MPSRRAVLRATGAVTAASAAMASAGCLSGPLGSTPVEPTTTTAASDTTEPSGPVRGEADEIAVEETIAAEKYEYVASNDTVRYPAAKSGGEVVEYGHQPFEEWTEVEGASVAARDVLSRLERALSSSDGVGAGIRRFDGGEFGVSVDVETVLDRDGEVVSEPAVEFPAVVDATPRGARATVHFAGRTGTHEYPVYVSAVTLRYD
ncbi:hypothetical protein G9C85_15650 [Halorubellus sp. JP-L1]|uniref:hypothetical protein n=1 Tax=Halorubellus sp. JP-L1 TaxID=2715753 RepID=UPI00140BC6FE|nr:hypothetical protein [Halorubellus sp. JP-L1]NHN43051.1 hypothetical protein [Halorubellus sp. JP-L1]